MYRRLAPIIALFSLASLVACTASEPDAGESSADQTSEREEFKEVVRPGEEGEFHRFMGEINELQEHVAKLTGKRVMRAFHAKSHACVGGELRVLPDRDVRAQFGVFAETKTIPAWVRFSNGGGSVESDTKSDARGLAIKLVGVEGQRLLSNDPAFAGEDGATTQDFLMTNKPRSTARDSRGFMAFAKAGVNIMGLSQAVKDHSLSASADTASGVASAFDDFLASGTEDLSKFDLVGKARIRLENAEMLREVMSRTKRRVDSMAQEQFWSGSAYKLGPKAVKYTFRPCEDLHKPVRPDDAPADYLATELASHLKDHTTCYDLFAQFQLDPEKQPIENAFKLWEESDTPPKRIAQLLIPPTDLADAGTRSETEYCEHLAFTPWHGVAEHRPLGNINRARKFVLKASQNLRKEEDAILDESKVRAPRSSRSAQAPADGKPGKPAATVGPCPIASEGAAVCDDCVRALCTASSRQSACSKADATADCATIESLCKECSAQP